MQKTIFLMAALLGASSASGSALATTVPATAETAIPFVSRESVLDWKADGDRGLYIRGGNGRWYYARTLGRCTRLVTANSLGFVTSALDQLDRHGAILVQGWRCPLASVVESPPPPKKKRR